MTSHTIVRSTPRAHLIADADGRQTWIKAGWRRADGSLTPAAVKALAEAQTPAEYRAAQQAERNATIPLADASGETEKALRFDCEVECVHTDQVKRATVWLPKSQVRNGEAPRWLVDKKIEETLERWADYGTSNLVLTGLCA